MTVIKFNKFTGLRPKLSVWQTDDAKTTSTQCLNVDLRKGVLSPLLASAATNFENPEGSGNALFYNPVTDMFVKGYHSAGVIVDDFRDPAISYTSLPAFPRGGVAVATDTAGNTAPMFLPRPTQGLGLTKVAGLADPTMIGAKSYIQAIASATLQTHAHTTPPTCIERILNTPPSAVRFLEYERNTITAALDRVLHFYTIQHSVANPITLHSALLDILYILDNRSDVVREQSGNHPKTTFADAEATVRASLKAFITRLSIYVYYELTGTMPNNLVLNSPDAMLPCPAWYLDNELAISPLMLVTPNRSAAGYTTGTDITIQYEDSVYPQSTHSDIGDAFAFAADSMARYGTTPVETIRLVLDEMETCRTNLLNGGSYTWKGLDASSTLGGTKLAPYTPSADALFSDTPIQETYYVPRAYCYTFIDCLGRESIRSTYTTLDGAPTAEDDNAPSIHTITVPALPQGYSYITKAAIYRSIPTTNPADQPIWSRVAVVDIDASSNVSVSIPLEVPTRLATLSTDDHLPLNFVPMYLRQTSTGYTVFTDAGRNTVYISRRNNPQAIPYNRQVSMPYGVRILSIQTVNDVIYIATNACPAYITIGEDKGAQGADIQVVYLKHAMFPITNDASHTATPWGIIYWSNVGLVMQVKDNAAVISAEMLDEDQTYDFCYPNHCAYHNGIFYSWVLNVCSIFDIPDATFSETPLAPLTQWGNMAAASLSKDGKLLLVPPDSLGSNALEEAFTGSPLPMTYQTHPVTLASPEVFTCVKVVGKNVQGTLYAYDGENLKWSVTVSGTNRMVRVPPYRFYDSVSVMFVGTAVAIAEISVADSIETLAE